LYEKPKPTVHFSAEGGRVGRRRRRKRSRRRRRRGIEVKNSYLGEPKLFFKIWSYFLSEPNKAHETC
jgi:hypothetical protein